MHIINYLLDLYLLVRIVLGLKARARLVGSSSRPRLLPLTVPQTPLIPLPPTVKQGKSLSKPEVEFHSFELTRERLRKFPEVGCYNPTIDFFTEGKRRPMLIFFLQKERVSFGSGRDKGILHLFAWPRMPEDVAIITLGSPFAEDDRYAEVRIAWVIAPATSSPLLHYATLLVWTDGSKSPRLDSAGRPDRLSIEEVLRAFEIDTHSLANAIRSIRTSPLSQMIGSHNSAELSMMFFNQSVSDETEASKEMIPEWTTSVSF